MILAEISNPLLHLKISNKSVTITEKQNIGNSTLLSSVTIVKMPTNESQFAYSRDSTTPRSLYNEFLNVQTPALETQIDSQDIRKGFYWGSSDIKCNPFPDLDNRADAVVISQNKSGEITAVICDLKSKHTDAQKCAHKFILDKLHLDYLVSLVNNLELAAPLPLRIDKYIYLIFTYDHSNSRIAKTPVRQDNNSQKSKIGFIPERHGVAKLQILEAKCFRDDYRYTWDDIVAHT